jgi:RNA polymerase sigma-70 factor (ECF subfamily)
VELIGKEHIESFERLFRRYYSFLVNMASQKLSGNYDASEDVVQDSFIKVCRKKNYLQIVALEERYRKNYLIEVVRNQTVDYCRREDKYILRPNYEMCLLKERNAENKQDDILKKIVIKTELMDILMYINTLSDKEKSIMRLLLYYDMNLGDVANIYDISISGIRKRLYRTRLKLCRFRAMYNR